MCPVTVWAVLPVEPWQSFPLPGYTPCLCPPPPCPVQALKEEGRTKEAERAFLRALALDEPGSPSVHALRVMAQMRQQKGEHWSAIKILDKALSYNKEDQVGGGGGQP